MTNKEAIEALLEIRQAIINSIDYKHRPSWVDDIIHMISDKVNNLSSAQATSNSDITNGEVFNLIFPNITRTGPVLLDKRENIIATNVNFYWWNDKYDNGDME